VRGRSRSEQVSRIPKLKGRMVDLGTLGGRSKRTTATTEGRAEMTAAEVVAGSARSSSSVVEIRKQ
jgi:hypothetical protein